VLFEADIDPVDLDVIAELLADMAQGDNEEEPLVWDAPLQVGQTEITLRVLAGAQGDVAFLAMACEVHDLDPKRMEQVELSPPLEEWTVELAEDDDDGAAPDDEGGERLDWLLIHADCPLADGAAGLQRRLDDASTLFRRLAEEGVVRLVMVDDVDPDVVARAAVLEEMKAYRPRNAMDAARHLADQSRAAGDFFAGAWFDLAASEVADELGEMTLCWDLASSAWATLGEPTDNDAAVVGYAVALAGRERYEEAVKLLERGEADALDAGAAAYVRGGKGVLLARWGRYAEAMEALDASVDEPSLDPQFAMRLRRTLAELRRTVGGREPPPSDEVDALDEVGTVLNHIASLLERPVDPAEFWATIPRVEDLLRSLRPRWDAMGTNQRARLVMGDGLVTFFRGDARAADRLFRQAVLLAEEAGHAALARSAALLRAALGTGGEASAGLLDGASPRDRLQFHFNRAFYGVVAAIARGARDQREFEASLTPALQAVRVVDEERHEFENIADRGGWAAFGGRAYEFALMLSTSLGRRDVAVELLERVRAQGLPEAAGEEQPPWMVARQVSDMLDVGAPRIATVSGESRVLPGAPTIRLADLVLRVGGPDAWWWTCHSFGQRLYWAVRAPWGEVVSGNRIVENAPGETPSLADLGRMFATPTVRADITDHILFEDRLGRLDPLLRRLAEDILPPPLADAARLAASQGSPIRLVWAPPPSLGNVPIGLLPLDDRYRLLHGAIATTAPPTSLAPAVPAPRRRRWGSEAIILGEGADLRHAAAIAGPAGLGAPPERVAGTWEHVGADPPLAGSVATPEDVTRSWAAADRPSLMLYYGHLDEGRPGVPLTASLRLSGPTEASGTAPLELRPLLAGRRHGAPDVVALCACSSLGPKSIGSGEWWGFGVALLWQGSRQVVGSLWNLVDGPATARFAVELVEALRPGDDPAVALHRLQRRWLRAWEERRGRPYADSEEDRHPIIWSGWAVTGVAMS